MQVLRSTGLCSTIQIEEKLFDDLQKCDVRLGFSSTWKQQLSNIKLVHGIQDNLEWKRTMKSLPLSIFKAIGIIFLSHQYGIAIAICANFQTPNFKGSACAELQAFYLKCPLEAFGGQIQHFYCIQKNFIPKSCVLGGAEFVIIILSST